MNLDSLRDFFEEIRRDLEDKENLSEIVQKILSKFHEIIQLIPSVNLSEREKMNDLLKTIQKQLDRDFEGIASQMGISSEELVKVILNSQNYKETTWQDLQELRKGMNKVKKTFLKTKTSQRRKSV